MKDCVMNLDFSELEKRVAASLTEQPKGIHLAKAMEMTGLPAEQVTPTMRNIAKQRNYFAMYSAPISALHGYQECVACGNYHVANTACPFLKTTK